MNTENKAAQEQAGLSQGREHIQSGELAEPEIARYDLVERQIGGGHMAVWEKELELAHEGEWCKYEDVRAALAAVPAAQQQAQSVPAGWKLVPVEPTPGMLDVAGEAMAKGGAEGNVLELQGDAHTAYSAMLAAAPTPAIPSPVDQDAKAERFTFDTFMDHCERTDLTLMAISDAKAIFNEALEFAARICDAKYAARVETGHPREASTAARLAEEIRNFAARSPVAAAPDYLKWWTSIETDKRKSLASGAQEDANAMQSLLRMAYEAGSMSAPAPDAEAMARHDEQVHNAALEKAAKVVESMGSTSPIMSYGQLCAAAIRALSQPSPAVKSTK